MNPVVTFLSVIVSKSIDAEPFVRQQAIRFRSFVSHRMSTRTIQMMRQAA